MRFRSSEFVRVVATKAKKHIFYSAPYDRMESTTDIYATFTGNGHPLNFIRFRPPEGVDWSSGAFICLTIKEDSSGTIVYSDSISGSYLSGVAAGDYAERAITDFMPTDGADYTLHLALKGSGAPCDDSAGSSADWPLSPDPGYKMVGELMLRPEATLYDSTGATITDYYPAAYIGDYGVYEVGTKPAGFYTLLVEGMESEAISLYVGSWTDYIDSTISSRASATIEADITELKGEVEDPSHGLAALRDNQDQGIINPLNDLAASVGTPAAGDGALHDKIGSYSGDSGDNNNIKDDIASLSIAGANARQIWEYAPDGTEGANSTADYLTRGTAAADGSKADLEDSSTGLSAIKGAIDDILTRLGDPGSEDITARLSGIMGELIDSGHGLSALKILIDAVQDSIGTPDNSADTVLYNIKVALSDLEDPADGLSAIKGQADSNGLNISEVLNRLGLAGDTPTAGTIWGDINGLEDQVALSITKIDSIISRLDSTAYGLSAIKSAIDSAISNQGDISTYGTLTAQSQSIKAILEDTAHGLSALRGILDNITATLGTPTAGSISEDIAVNLQNINALDSEITAIQLDITELLNAIGDPGAEDITARLIALSADITAILSSLGPYDIATVQEKLGDYDGVRTETGGILLMGHRVKDDMESIKDTLISAQFPGSGQYLNTQGGYYANNQFYPVGSGPVVNDSGAAVEGARITAFADSDGDGIFERVLARAYSDASGMWQMALDSGFYLLSFYKPGYLLKYEWRVIDPDNSGLQPPAHAPTGADLPGGGGGLI